MQIDHAIDIVVHFKEQVEEKSAKFYYADSGASDSSRLCYLLRPKCAEMA